jgi:hypothetical protein
MQSAPSSSPSQSLSFQFTIVSQLCTED